MTERNQAFRELYESLDFAISDGEGEELPQGLHETCSMRDLCWKDAITRQPPAGELMSYVSRPWIGSQYEQLRLAVVGVNFYEFGGFGAMDGLMRKAKEELASGARRVRFGNSFAAYRGSTLWHRIGCYAVVFAEQAGHMKANWGNDGFPGKEDVISGLDHIAFVNQVKCSPCGERSWPTPEMFENCPKHVLGGEIEVLRPKDILFLGAQGYALLVRDVLGWQMTPRKTRGLATCVINQVKNEQRRVFNLPHPSMPAGMGADVLSDLRGLLVDLS